MDENKYTKNKEAEMGGKTTIWTLQAKHRRDRISEDMDMAKKGKPQARNRISYNCSTR